MRKTVAVIATVTTFGLTTGIAATVDITDLAAFLSVTPADFDAVDTAILNPDTSYNGSAVTQTVNVAAGDRLDFDWAMLTDEDPGQISDYVFYSISGPAGASVYHLTNAGDGSFSTAGTAFAHQTTFSHESYTFSVAGAYDIGFGVVNANDHAVGSALIFDAVVGTGFSVSNGGFESGDYTGWSPFNFGGPEYVVPTSALGLGPIEGTFQAMIATPDAPAVPEPGTALLLATAGVSAWRARRRRSTGNG